VKSHIFGGHVTRNYKLISCLAEDFITCRQVRNYLRYSDERSLSLDLWTREEGRQKLTPKGYVWEKLQPESSIQGKHLVFVTRMSPGNYIVASKLVEEPMGEESPVPLGSSPYILVPLISDIPPIYVDIVRIGEECCIGACRDVQQHLGGLLAEYRLLRAMTIQDGVEVKDWNDGTDALTQRWDDNLCALDKTTLFIKLRRRHQ